MYATNFVKQTKCLRKGRRFRFITEGKPKRTYALQMKEKMDTEKGRQMYSERMGIVEPVFANIRYNKNMNRFTLKTKGIVLKMKNSTASLNEVPGFICNRILKVEGGAFGTLS